MLNLLIFTVCIIVVANRLHKEDRSELDNIGIVLWSLCAVINGAAVAFRLFP